MDIGLLWFDKSADDMLRKIERAARRYKERFGQTANVCYVHPDALDNGDRQVGKVWVRSSARVLKHHFWIGWEQPHEARK